MTAVTNTGPLIALAKLNHLHLLPNLYDRVLVPQAVQCECVLVGRERGYEDAEVIVAFLERMGWESAVAPPAPPELGGDVRLGQGKVAAIALALQQRAVLLIDEVYARAIAEGMGIDTAGTMGILVETHRRGHLKDDMLDELLTAIESREDIWIHPALCHRVRREVLQR